MSERRLPSRGTGGVFVATCLLVLAEFALLIYVYHLDDDVDRQYAAFTHASGTLSSVADRPSRDVAATTGRAVQGLIDAGIDQDAALLLADAYHSWVVDPSDTVALDLLRDRTGSVGQDIGRQQVEVDLVATALYAMLLAFGALTLFLGFRRAFRRHRRVQQVLAERESVDVRDRRLVALVENSADVIAILDHDSTVLFANSSANDVLGILPDHLVGQRILDLAAPGDASTLARHLVTQRAGEHPVTLRLALGRDLHRVLEGTLRNLVADPAVNGWVLTVRDVTDRVADEATAGELAFHDALTGLTNRELFADRLDHALARRLRRPEPVTVLVCDLDDFKHVNGSRGHDIGDGLLVEVGARLRGALGPGDTAARLGGDEFAVLLEGRDAVDAEQLAQRLQDLFAEPFRVDGSAVAVRASIGIAEAEPGETAEELLRNADVAMCWAKERGKSTVAVYEAGLHALALERLSIRSELQHAIRDDQLVLHYQPTVDLLTESITGFEALVRWQHPSRGLLPPQAFIGVAEQSGLIVELGAWVLREACHAAVSLRTLVQQPTMSVNVAAQQIVRPDFVELVADVLVETGLVPHHLVLEITESVLLDDVAFAAERLAALRALGVHVAIDDFGTGYSSLSYLSRLPVDILKVDKSFVDDVCGDSHGASVTEAIIAMSRTMQLTTVAEGVELPEQAAWLQNASCQLGQGFLWSRPVELAGARHLLASGVPRQRTQLDPARPRQAWPPADTAV